MNRTRRKLQEREIHSVWQDSAPAVPVPFAPLLVNSSRPVPKPHRALSNKPQPRPLTSMFGRNPVMIDAANDVKETGRVGYAKTIQILEARRVDMSRLPRPVFSSNIRGIAVSRRAPQGGWSSDHVKPQSSLLGELFSSAVVQPFMSPLAGTGVYRKPQTPAQSLEIQAPRPAWAI